MTPAKEVGGDFYDFFMVDDDHLALVMADVSGKGVPAALFMVIAKTLIKNSALSGDLPNEILYNVNNQLCENNESDMFVTSWVGILEISTGKLVCSNAGHEYPVVRNKDGEYNIVKDPHGFVLGGMEGMRYKNYEITLSKGEQLFVYTDGVPEATNISDELFGTERMIESLNSQLDDSPKDTLIRVKSFVDDFVGDGPQFDDLTMLALNYYGN